MQFFTFNRKTTAFFARKYVVRAAILNSRKTFLNINLNIKFVLKSRKFITKKLNKNSHTKWGLTEKLLLIFDGSFIDCKKMI